MRIYTRQGDRGRTRLFGGRAVAKDDLRLETYGALDEVNSLLGLAAAGCRHAEVTGLIARLQVGLLVLSADLATPREDGGGQKGIQRVDAKEVAELERAIDRLTAMLPELRHFVVPGGSETAARLHVARATCRRAERWLVKLMREQDVGDAALQYVNRFSDLLFVLARRANYLDGRPDVIWEGRRQTKDKE